MKRSEMIDFMVQNWLGLFNDIPEGVEEETYENMDKLLATLEHKGMRPPKRIISPEQWITRDEITIKQGDIKHRSWEPENE